MMTGTASICAVQPGSAPTDLIMHNANTGNIRFSIPPPSIRPVSLLYQRVEIIRDIGRTRAVGIRCNRRIDQLVAEDSEKVTDDQQSVGECIDDSIVVD